MIDIHSVNARQVIAHLADVPIRRVNSRKISQIRDFACLLFLSEESAISADIELQRLKRDYINGANT